VESPIQPAVEALEGAPRLLTEGVCLAADAVGGGGENGSMGGELGEGSGGTADVEVADDSRGRIEHSKPHAATIKVHSIRL